MEPFESRGIWWLPDKPDTRVSGVLKYNPDDRTILELIGSFKPPSEMGKFGTEMIILGVTPEGKEITLYKCMDFGSQLAMAGFMTWKYLVTVVFVGHHFVDESSLLFRSMALDYEDLHMWAGITGFDRRFEANQGDEGWEETISYRLPKPVSTSVDHLTFSIQQRYISGGDRLQEINLKQTTSWKIETAKETHYRDYHEEICYHIQNFLTLAMAHRARPKRIVGNSEAGKNTLDDGRVVYDEIEIFYALGRRTTERTIEHPHEMLFLFADIRDHFQTCLSNWFSKTQLLGPVYDLYFGLMTNDSMYIQQQFLTLAQALESYHRRVRGGVYVDPLAFAPIYERLIAAIPHDTPEGFRESMESRLKYFAEYSLRKRLTDLLGEIGDLIPRHRLIQGQIIQDIVLTRNYLTHYDETLADKAKKGDELWGIVQDMKTMMRTVLMLELGIPRDLIRSLLERHFRFG